MQDLWMLLFGEPIQQRRQFDVMLEDYRQFHDLNPAERHLAEALRLIHYAAWIAQRWHGSAFLHAFSWFDSLRYWQDHILNLREQIALMDEPPLAEEISPAAPSAAPRPRPPAPACAPRSSPSTRC
ncbi:hypothetical protein [Denitromonas iodatirespirans]|uniref:Uncharacterized protein n=1 Tax=Denitromonas iodatirespirans TaxID=2795389 RepID=A0A944HAY9_DENI1|nr:hypothetical protein [Denitromonas iodatirespirans]MBT0963970.1 hypothetical protein [Denitromonas iodatirespirans]